MRKVLLAVLPLTLGLASPALAGLAGTTIALAGVQIRNGLNQTRTSAPDTVGAAYIYNTDIVASARGVGGALGFLFPNPTPITTILSQLTGVPVTSLAAQVANPSGALPASLPPTTQAGTTVVSGITVTYSFTLTTAINAAGVASFSITNVVLQPAFLVGYLEFTSGNAVINRVCPGDANGDNQINFSDLNVVLGQFGVVSAPGSPLQPGDVNGDDSVNFLDLNIVLGAFGTGC